MKQESKQTNSKYARKKKTKSWVIVADKEVIKDDFHGTYRECYSFIRHKFPAIESPETMIQRRTN